MGIEQIGIIFLIVVITVAGSVGIYYAVTGIIPGASVIAVTDAPITTASGMDKDQSKFMFFYAPWCPYSKAAEESWASLKQDYKNSPQNYGNKTISFEDIDGDNQKAKMALYGVTKFPTFKFQTDDKVYEMLGSPSVANFRTFIKTVLDKKSS